MNCSHRVTLDGVGTPRITATALLSEIGTRTSARLAERVAEFGLTPVQVRVLREVDQRPGISQTALAERLEVAPSRVVKLIDELAEQGLIERRPHDEDRRRHSLHVAAKAKRRMEQVRAAVRAHDEALMEPLTVEERDTLRGLLEKLYSKR